MVRFSPADSKISWHDAIVLPAMAVLTFLVISIVWIAKVGASLDAFHSSAAAPVEISLVLEWITKTGKPSVVRASVAEGFGLRAADVPVTERGFRGEGERLTHVCAVGVGSASEHLVFFSTVDEADGSATVWQTNKNCDLLSTVVFQRGIVQKVPNARFEAEFRHEVNYFQAKAASDRRGAQLASGHPRIASGYTTSDRPKYAPLRLETMVLASSPFVLPAIVLVLIASSTGRRRG